MTPEPTRTTGSKSARTRERIVTATAQVLSARGYAGTRLSDIAELAEVRAPAIYYYFPSRDDLIEEAVTVGLTQAAQLVDTALASLPSSAGPFERIDAAVEAHLHTLLTHGVHAAAAIQTINQLPYDVRARQLHAQRAYVDRWRRLLDEADAAGDLDPTVDRRAALMLVLNALNSTATWWSTGWGCSLDHLVSTARTLVRNGLCAREESTPHTARVGSDERSSAVRRPPPPARGIAGR
jgi:AcrR family transcriptional regulator